MAWMSNEYDVDTAISFASRYTGVDEATAAKVLESLYRFQMGMGIGPDDDGDGARLRELWPELFPPENMAIRYVDVDLEQRFVARDSGVASATIQAVLDADMEYLKRLGLAEEV